MKKILWALLVLTFFLGALGALLRNPVFVSASESEFSKETKSILATELSVITQTLISSTPFRNHQNTSALTALATYIYGMFEQNCDRVEYQPYTVDGAEYNNVICHFNGDSEDLVVVGAHYDVAGEQDGADDNASGVASVLQLAQLIKQKNKRPRHNLQLVAYTLEEPPFFRSDWMGSHVHASWLKKNNAKVKYMISVEMVGYYSDKGGSQDYPSPLLHLFYPSTGNFLALVGGIKEFWLTRPIKATMAEKMELSLYSINSPAFVPGIDFSDHLNYWKYGYQAFMLTDTAFLRNKNYHQTSDTIDTLNFQKMAEVVIGLYYLVL